MCNFGSSTQTSKSTTKPSGQYQDLIKSLGNLATTAANRPLKQYTGPRVAGFTPDQTAGMNAVRASQTSWQPYLNTASQYAAQGANPITGIPNVGTSGVSYNKVGNAPGINAQTIAAQQVGNAPAVGTSGVNASMIGQGPNVGTSGVDYSAYTPDQFSAEGLSQFYNPYQQNVIDSSLANIRRSDALQQEDLLGRAIASGNAFGGDRAGLAAAELARGQGMARNQQIAQLEAQGFNTALGAFQNQQGLNSQAGFANAANALSASGQNAANQLSASGQNAANWYAAQQANQQAGLTASQANAANQLTASGQNSANWLSGNLANQQAALQAAQANQGSNLTAQQQNAANWLQSNLANQQAGLTASERNATNRLAASSANATNALTAAQANQTAAARAAEQFGGLGQQTQQQGLAGAGALLQSGALQQLLQQNQLDIPYQNFQQQQQYPQQQAQWLLNTLMGIPAQSFGSTTTTQQPGPSALSQIAGGIGAIGSLGLGGGGTLWKRGGGISDYAAGGRAQGGPGGGRDEPVYANPVSYAPAVNYGIGIPMLNTDTYAVDMNAGYEGPNLTGFDYDKKEYPPAVYKMPKNLRKAINAIDFGNMGGGSAGSYGSDQWAMQTGGPGAMAWRELFRNIGSLSGGKNKGNKKALGGIADDEDMPEFSLTPLGDIRIPQPAGLGEVEATSAEPGAPSRNMVRIPTDQPIMPPKQVASSDPFAMSMDGQPPPEAGGIAAAARGPAGAPQSRFSRFLESPAGAAFQGSLAMLGGESPNAGVNIGQGLLYGVEAYKKAQAAKAMAQADRDPKVITREDGSVYLMYPDSNELVEMLPALPQAPAKRNTTTVGNDVVDTDTGDVVYSGEDDPGLRPATEEDFMRWQMTPKPGQSWGIDKDGKPVLVYDQLAQIEDPFERERYLRNDFDKIAQNYRLLQESYGKIETGVKSPTAAGDVALIFSYMRMLDPSSTVREGEFATAQQTAGLPTTIVNLYNQLLTGERLAPEQRADFASTARGLLDAQYGQYVKTATQYRDLAVQYGLNPDRVVSPESLKEPAVAPAKDTTAPPLAPYSITDPGLLGPPSTFSPSGPPPPGSYRWSPQGLTPVTP